MEARLFLVILTMEGKPAAGTFRAIKWHR